MRKPIIDPVTKKFKGSTSDKPKEAKLFIQMDNDKIRLPDGMIYIKYERHRADLNKTEKEFLDMIRIRDQKHEKEINIIVQAADMEVGTLSYNINNLKALIKHDRFYSIIAGFVIGIVIGLVLKMFM